MITLNYQLKVGLLDDQRHILAAKRVRYNYNVRVPFKQVLGTEKRIQDVNNRNECVHKIWKGKT
jgi:hypothetical protein